MRIVRDQNGLVSLASTIVILGAALVIAISVQFIGIGELLIGFGGQQSENAFQLADSCMNEALLRLKRNNAYTGATLSLNGDSCTIAVSGSGGTRTITVDATVGSAVRSIRANVTISGSNVTITSWEEDLT